ncbi:autotransporter outer membrane beta-barrel domain-containing protein [Castellaniella sp. WN]
MMLLAMGLGTLASVPACADSNVILADGTTVTESDIAISTTGGNSPAVTATHAGLVELGNVEITTGGYRSYGVYAEKNSVIVIDGASISTNNIKGRITQDGDGSRAYALYARDPGSSIRVANVDIVTLGQRATGAFANAGAIVTLSDSTVSTEGFMAYGLYAGGQGSVLDATNVDVTSIGQVGDALWAYDHGVLNIDGGHIVVNGSSNPNAPHESATGLVSAASGAINANSISVLVNGNDNIGINVLLDGFVALTHSNVTTTGSSSDAALVGYGGILAATGSTLTSEQSRGVDLFDNASVTLTGSTIKAGAETFVSSLSQAGQTQTIVMDGGSLAMQNNGTLLLVQRSAGGTDGHVLLSLGQGSKTSGDMLDEGDKTGGGYADVAIGEGAFWSGAVRGVRNFDNRGTISPANSTPGNALGQVSLAGDYHQASGAAYDAGVVPGSPVADLIHVDGTATIDNGAILNVLRHGSAPITIDAHYTVLTADGGVSGTYVVTGDTRISAFYALVAEYDAKNVYLNGVRTRSFADAGWTPNQIASAGGLESLPAGNPLRDAIELLQTDAEARTAFDQVSGEIHASARAALIEDSRFIRIAVNDRMRAAFGDVGASTVPVMTYGADGAKPAAPTTAGLAVWGQGFGSWGRASSDGNAARLDRSISGFFFGADAPMFGTWRFGAVAGYSHTDFDARDRHSSGSSDNYHVGLYGGTAWGDLAFRTGAAYTWHDIATNRGVTFPGFSDRAKGGYDAATAQFFGELGYGFNAGRTRFEPFANFAYVRLHADGVAEKGGMAALVSPSADIDTTFTTAGLRVSTAVDVGGASLTANGMLGWRHAFGDMTHLLTMRFAGGGDVFSIGGVPVARDAAVIEAGLDYAITPASTLGVSYGGQFGSGLSDQSVRARLNVKF